MVALIKTSRTNVVLNKEKQKEIIKALKKETKKKPNNDIVVDDKAVGQKKKKKTKRARKGYEWVTEKYFTYKVNINNAEQMVSEEKMISTLDAKQIKDLTTYHIATYDKYTDTKGNFDIQCSGYVDAKQALASALRIAKDEIKKDDKNVVCWSIRGYNALTKKSLDIPVPVINERVKEMPKKPKEDLCW